MVAAGLDWALGVLARVGWCLELVAAGDSIDDCLALIRHGIDIVRVLCGDDTDGGPTIHRHDYVQVRELEGAFEALARLVRAHGVEAVHLVSKCSPATELRTLEWLAARDLEGRTGIPWSQVHFVRARADKRRVCDALGLTRFVDDRWTVLQHLEGLEQLWLFRPLPNEAELWRSQCKDPHVRKIEAWSEFEI
jgi:hypothetical protein